MQAARGVLLDVLGSSSALAAGLAGYHVLGGSWRCLLRDLRRIEELTQGEVRDVAARYLHPGNRFVGTVLPL